MHPNQYYTNTHSFEDSIITHKHNSILKKNMFMEIQSLLGHMRFKQIFSRIYSSMYWHLPHSAAKYSSSFLCTTTIVLVFIIIPLSLIVALSYVLYSHSETCIDLSEVKFISPWNNAKSYQVFPRFWVKFTFTETVQWLPSSNNQVMFI